MTEHLAGIAKRLLPFVVSFALLLSLVPGVASVQAGPAGAPYIIVFKDSGSCVSA
jgi:hypothetical protein